MSKRSPPFPAGARKGMRDSTTTAFRPAAEAHSCERIFAWIKWDDMAKALRAGWLPCERGDPCHHNHYATLCEWRCCCERDLLMIGRQA